MPRPPLKLIEWEDAYNGNHDWMALDAVPAKDDPLLVSTVGFEMRRGKGSVTLAMSISDNGRCCDLFTIPIGMIRREKVLR